MIPNSEQHGGHGGHLHGFVVFVGYVHLGSSFIAGVD